MLDQLERTHRLGPRPLLPPLDPYGHACARRDRRPASSPAARASTSPTRNGKQQPRRLRRALLRQCRLRPPEDRRRDRRAGEEPRLLPRLCRPRHRGLDHARQDDHRPRAEGHEPRLFRPVRLGRQRDQHQADLVLQQRPRPAREEEDHLALARLSRLRRDDRLADRARALPQRLRPAARADPAHRGALLFPPRRPLDERGAVLAASAPTSSRR